MSDIHWINSVSLRFFSEVMSADEMAAALHVKADELHRIGDLFTSRRGVVHVRHNNAIYLYSGLSEESPLDNHLEAVLSRAKEATEAVRILAGRITMSIHCRLRSRSNWRGFLLSPEMMRLLSDLELTVLFDLEVFHHSSDDHESREA